MILIIWFDITRFRNKEYNPRLLRPRQESEWNIKGFATYLGWFMSVMLIKKPVLKVLYSN